MSESDTLYEIQQEFHQLGRKLTYVTIGIVCIFALIFYSMGLELKGSVATLVGAMFIVLAAITFQIPQLSYRYLLKKYKNDADKLAALGSNWPAFRDAAMRAEKRIK